MFLYFDFDYSLYGQKQKSTDRRTKLVIDEALSLKIYDRNLKTDCLVYLSILHICSTIFRYAPCNPVLMEGEALATAAANRSAAFYQTKQYIQAIEDIGELLGLSTCDSNSVC